jgi:MFS transporter, ACS family, glucarate transporter
MNAPPATTPTRARHWVIVFAVTLAVITYIDRVCISQAAGDIQRDLRFTKEQMSWVFSAFTFAYALFEIPAGWLGDRNGPRGVLMRVVLMWSIFTAATGRAWNLASMIVCRFLFGVGEAGCFPNLTKIFTIWLPRDERVRAQGIMWLSARWGGAFTPLLVFWVMTFLHWRQAFMLFGALGIVWAFVFYFWFRDNPRDHPSVNAAELALLDGAEQNAAGHSDVPWRRFLRSRTVWLLWLQYFCMSYGWYFYITWLPTYLKEARGVELGKSALLSGLPLFFGGTACFVVGLIVQRLAKWTGSVQTARRIPAAIGLFAAAILLVISTHIQSPTLAMLTIALASFANDSAMPSGWSACMDVGGKYAGSLSGSMNMMGNLGGAVGPLVVAQILKFTGNNWSVCFWAAAGIYLIGAASWLLIDPVTPLDGTEPPRQ